MSEEGFEKGLKLLLNQAYHKPEPSERFRSDLLCKLRQQQKIRVARKRSRTIALFASFSTAAAAAVAITVLPAATQTGSEAPRATASAPLSPSAVQELASSISGRSSGFAIPVATGALPNRTPSEPQAMIANNRPVLTPAAITPPAALGNISGLDAHALNPVEIRSGAKATWRTLQSGENFTLQNGLQIRTPVGAAEPVGLALRNGMMVMLDGMSELNVSTSGLSLHDGQAVVSLRNSKNALGMNLGGQEVALQPGAMAFMRIENNEDYAAGGAPAPVLVLLKGQANPGNQDANALTAGQVYELYNTGTGRYPSRELGSYENQRRFLPIINAMQAANEYY